MIRIRDYIAALALVALAGGAAYAATPEAAAAIKARKANYREIGGAFKAINDELKSGSPDLNTVRPAARNIASRAPLLLKFFPRGSGPETGVTTRAKPEIWQNNAAFTKLQNDLVVNAKAFDLAATSGDSARMIAAMAQVGGTCKACHDRFRAPK